MAHVSHTEIIGNLGSDPKSNEVNGHKVCNFSVAVNKKKQDGTERTTWYNVGAWNALADICQNNLKKGRLVYIRGEMLEPRAWTADDGSVRASNQLMANEVVFLDSPNNNGGRSAPPDDEPLPF